MKKLILILAISLTTIAMNAQLFVTIEPAYFRPGLLYNHNFSNIGVYGKFWYGDIQKRTWDDYFYTQNAKIGIGISFFIERDITKLWVGVNHNYFWDATKEQKLADLNEIKKTSFDIGVSSTQGRFTFLMMSDLINWESIIGINFKFKK